MAQVVVRDEQTGLGCRLVLPDCSWRHFVAADLADFHQQGRFHYSRRGVNWVSSCGTVAQWHSLSIQDRQCAGVLDTSWLPITGQILTACMGGNPSCKGRGTHDDPPTDAPLVQVSIRCECAYPSTTLFAFIPESLRRLRTLQTYHILAMESFTQNIERHEKEGKPVDNADVDNAKLFLDGTLIDGELDVPLGKIRRLIDWRIIPIMFCCYTLQFLDKVILNYAAVMGLGQDLKLRGNDFSNANTFTFVALLIAEIPNGDIPFANHWSDRADVITGWVLNKMAAGRWLGLNVFAWGISTGCVAAARNYVHLLIARIFLGIFEASIGPCLMIISSQWYTSQNNPYGLPFG